MNHKVQRIVHHTFTMTEDEAMELTRDLRALGASKDGNGRVDRFYSLLTSRNVG